MGGRTDTKKVEKRLCGLVVSISQKVCCELVIGSAENREWAVRWTSSEGKKYLAQDGHNHNGRVSVNEEVIEMVFDRMVRRCDDRNEMITRAAKLGACLLEVSNLDLLGDVQFQLLNSVLVTSLRARRKVFKSPSSFSYIRLLPYLQDIDSSNFELIDTNLPGKNMKVDETSKSASEEQYLNKANPKVSRNVESSDVVQKSHEDVLHDALEECEQMTPVDADIYSKPKTDKKLDVVVKPKPKLVTLKGNQSFKKSLKVCSIDKFTLRGTFIRPGPVWGCDGLVSRAKVMENQGYGISVICAFLPDSSEDSAGDTCWTTDTPVIPTETPIIPRRRVMILSPRQPILMVDHHSSPDLPSTSAGPSSKRRRSPMTYVPALSPVSRALSPVCADLIPSPKRVKDSGYLADVEVDPREISLRDDTIVRVSDEPYLEQDTDPDLQAEIDECIAYADALRDRGIDARVVVEAVDQDETETGVRGPVKVRVERVTHPVMPEDIPEPSQEGAVEVTYETLGDLVQRFHDHTQAILVHRIQAIEGVQREQGHRIIGVESAVTALTERVVDLERDNRRLRGTMSVESQRVD
ncbi:hypothetical protein Tco_0364894 [Tanacetum coccineum]